MLEKGRFTFIIRQLCSLCLAILLLLPMGLNGEQVAHANNGEEIVVNPTPQQLTERGEGFALTSVIGLVVGEATDTAAIREVQAALKTADVERIERRSADEPLPDTPVTIWVGGPSENAASAEVLESLNAQGPEELKEEGYVFVADVSQGGEHQIVLAGKDQVGTFYAAQTFKQTIQERSGDHWVPAVEIRDWPDMPIRGTIEGFYGPPWSHDDRLDQLRFYGEHKMNAYIYAPKDDPYHREKWREPYPEDELAELQALVDQANAQHVNFTFGISPGNTICFSDDDDFAALLEKAEAVWDLGVRSFAIFLDDIDPTLRCTLDREKFGEDRNPPASAQAYLLNRFNAEFIQTHEGAERLITVPTEYSQSGTSPYREVFADQVDPDVIVQWTGIGVVAPTITAEDAEKIHGIFKHDLLIWDNYPVNDYDRSRLFLGPLAGRDADLSDYGVIGSTVNPMNEAEASKISLYTVADYLWNPHAYNPEESWNRSIDYFGGEAADALKTFAENTYSSALNKQEALTLAPLIEEFWNAYAAGAKQSSAKLLDEFKNIEQAPAILRESMVNEDFLSETAAWLDKLETYGKAGQTAVNMLMADLNDDIERAAHYRAVLDDILENDNTDVFIPETRQATKELDGINRNRGENELILYTPEHGSTTGTNIWGYEITVVDDTIVKTGGNNSPIPDNGYVLSLHANHWLRDNSIVGAKVQIENNKVTITIPEGVYSIPNDAVMAPGVIQPFIDRAIEIHEDRSAAEIKAFVTYFEEKGEIMDDRAAYSLTLHLTAVSHYEEKELADKVVKHMESFKRLLDHQKRNERITEEAYHILKTSADYVIRNWQ